jgi:hypothetical protein
MKALIRDVKESIYVTFGSFYELSRDTVEGMIFRPATPMAA